MLVVPVTRTGALGMCIAKKQTISLGWDRRHPTWSPRTTRRQPRSIHWFSWTRACTIFHPHQGKALKMLEAGRGKCLPPNSATFVLYVLYSGRVRPIFPGERTGRTKFLVVGDKTVEYPTHAPEALTPGGLPIILAIFFWFLVPNASF